MHRHDARVMLNMVSQALSWENAPLFPNASEENFQKAVGVFVKDAEPGFRGVDFQGMLTWEARYGACASDNAGDSGGGVEDSCIGKCGGESDGCFCDDGCQQFGDCCPDFEAVCEEGNLPDLPEGADWIAQLQVVANALNSEDDPVLVRDLVVAMKDRLINEPDLVVKEGPLCADLFGADSLDTPISDLPNWQARMRYYCGVLLSTPQFLLTGVAGATQETAPKLTVGPDTYSDHCEYWASIIYDPAVWTVTCYDDTVVVTPFAPPLGGL